METDILTFSDELGPSKIVHIYNPKNDLRAILAIDNVAAGPSIGGIRMAKDVTEEEAFRLARAMTLKNAAAGLPHGGGKAVIQADPKTLSKEQKETLIRSFALAIELLSEYIPGPDMGTDEVCMAWIKDEIGRAVGLPRELGGIPLDEIGATGLGLTEAAKTAGDFYGVDLKGAKVCIQGFGAVGKHAARFFSQLGALIISVADSQGTVTNIKGLDLETLTAVKQETGSVIHYKDGEKGDTLEIVKVPCDIWIPCARPDIIHVDNVSKLQTKLIVQGANIPISREAEEILFKNGVHVIPDFIANAGGVICAAVEYHGGSQQAALSMVKEKISFNTNTVIRQSWEQKIPPREVASKLALTRVKKAMQLRRD
ncbi:MAG: Glu/Leu/Phe/Val dehydrogenase [Cyclobacteriaceae bacterium]|nr:Glu/Leu/Phe/Val dehydrogenase [Cyclobacteriaceae bacterium]